MKKACCGFGHRNIFERIEDKVYMAIINAAEQGCEIFYTGAMGDFDSLFSSSVRKVKKSYPNIKLICVKPYFTNDINTDRDYYVVMYDDVIIPDELADIHPKAAIKARNRWIIDNSDMVLMYTIRNEGGAYEAKRYAERKSKTIINLSE